MFGLGSDVGRGCTHARNPDGSASGAAGYCSRLFCHKPRATTRGSILRSCHRSWSLPVGWMWWWRSGTVNSSLCACIEFASVHRCQNALVDLLAYASALACPITIFANEQWPPLLLADFRERWTQLASAPPAWGARPFLRIPVQSAEAFDVSAPRYQMSFASLIAVTVIVPPGCKKHQQQPAVMDARPKSGDSPLLSRHDSSPKGWFNVWRPLFAGVQEAWSRDRSELKSRPVFIPLFRRFFQYPLWFLANRS
jgi:hypothetical protein